MKKFLAIGLAAAFSVTMFAGCHKKGENTAPTIKGVQEEASVVAGNVWDALAGVTATDEEDGDLTSSIKVEARGLTFTDGKVTPAQARTTPYNVTYSVTDSEGETATATCKLTVDPATAELVNVYESDFSDVAPTWHDWDEAGENVPEGNNHYWKLEKNEDNGQKPEATATIEEGMLKVDVTDRKNLGDDKLMLTRHFDGLEIGTYKFIVWVRATAADDAEVKINMQTILDDSSAKNTSWDGKALGNYDEDNYYTNEEDVPHGLFGAKVGSSFKAIEFDFSITEKKINGTTASAIFRIALGGNDNPNAFKVDIEKIVIEKTTGSNAETDVFDKSNVTSVADLGLTLELGDGAENNVSTDFVTAEKETKIVISQYNTSGGSFSIVANIPITGKTINTTDTFGYSFDIKADNAYSNAEVHCGSSDRDTGDKWYAAAIGEINSTYKNLYHTFKFDQDYSEAVVHIFLGRVDNSPSETSNNIYIKNFRFFKVEGDKKTDKILDKFTVFGDEPVSVFNQSDDVFDAAPMGTAYFENGKLVYLIHQGGSDQGHNKLSIGFWDNPIGPLSANAFYVVSFKIKASVAIQFALALHDMEGGWDEGVGVLLRYADFNDNGLLEAGTEEKTITVETGLIRTAHEKCELLLEFGKWVGENKDVKIEISDVKIGYRAVV